MIDSGQTSFRLRIVPFSTDSHQKSIDSGQPGFGLRFGPRSIDFHKETHWFWTLQPPLQNRFVFDRILLATHWFLTVKLQAKKDFVFERCLLERHWVGTVRLAAQKRFAFDRFPLENHTFCNVAQIGLVFNGFDQEQKALRGWHILRSGSVWCVPRPTTLWTNNM